MRFIRIALVCCLALATLGLIACTSGPEQAWDAFVDAVKDGRADDALEHMDLVRMTERILAEDEEMAAAAEMFGGTEGIASLLEAEFRAAFAEGEFGLDDTDTSLVDSDVADTEIDGDLATLIIEAENETGTVYMERIDGDWKIVMFE